MKLNFNNSGFTLFESLVGLILFSLMLMYYLPGYQNELFRLGQQKETTIQWQLLYDLSEIYQSLSQKHLNDSADYQNISEELINNRIASYELQEQKVIEFQCDWQSCLVIFEDGVHHEITLLKIE